MHLHSQGISIHSQVFVSLKNYASYFYDYIFIVLENGKGLEIMELEIVHP